MRKVYSKPAAEAVKLQIEQSLMLTLSAPKSGEDETDDLFTNHEGGEEFPWQGEEE